MVATVLEPHGLIRAQARLVTSYQPGDIRTFRKGWQGAPACRCQTPRRGHRPRDRHRAAHAGEIDHGTHRPQAHRLAARSLGRGRRTTRRPSPRSRRSFARETGSSSPATTTAPIGSTDTSPRSSRSTRKGRAWSSSARTGKHRPTALLDNRDLWILNAPLNM